LRCWRSRKWMACSTCISAESFKFRTYSLGLAILVQLSIFQGQ
jgi:hypothetical protein